MSQNAKEKLYWHMVNVNTAGVKVKLFLCFSIPGEWNPQTHPYENLKTCTFLCLTNLRQRAPATNRINGLLGPITPRYGGGEKNLWLSLSNEPQFLGCPAHNSVIVLSELCHLHYKSDSHTFKMLEINFLSCLQITLCLWQQALPVPERQEHSFI